MFEPESTRSVVFVFLDIDVVEQLNISSTILNCKLSELNNHFRLFVVKSGQVGDFEFVIGRSKSNLGLEIGIHGTQIVSSR